MPNAEPVLLCLILAVLCFIAWQMTRAPGHVTKATAALADATDSIKFAGAVSQQVRDALTTLPRRIAQQFPEAVNARVIPEPPAVDPHPSGRVAVPATPIVLPAAAQGAAPASAPMPEPPWMGELRTMHDRMRTMAAPADGPAWPVPTQDASAPGFMLVQTPAGVAVQPTPGATVAVMLPAGGAGDPEPAAQTMPMADPTPGVVPAAAPAVAA